MNKLFGRLSLTLLSIAVVMIATMSSFTGVAAAASGSYKIMVIGTFSGLESYEVPEIVPAVKAVFRHDPGVTVLSCDDQFSSGDALDCEHEAVTDGVSVVVAGFAEVAANESILTQAGIPVIGTTDTTSANSFSLSNGTGLFAGIGTGLAKAGCTRLGVLYLDGTAVLANAIVGNVKWKSVTEAAIPMNSPDLSAPIAKLAEGKVQCIAISTEPNTVIQAMTAISQARLHVKIGMVSSIVTPQVISSLGKLGNGIISVEGNVDPDSSASVVSKIKSEMKAVDPSAPVTQAAVVAWASADLVSQAASKIKGAVTAASMMKALNGLRNATTDGALPPISAIDLKNPAFKRFFGHYAIDYVIENGHPKPLTGFFDLTSSLKS
jgi:hypothetical protein